MKRFTMKDEEFICENCGKKVLPLKYSASKRSLSLLSLL